MKVDGISSAESNMLPVRRDLLIGILIKIVNIQVIPINSIPQCKARLRKYFKVKYSLPY